MRSRRSFLLGGSVAAAAALGAIGYRKTLRFPRMGFEPSPMSTEVSNQSASFKLSELIALDVKSSHFRAIAPEPRLEMAVKKGLLTVNVNNIVKEAKLVVLGPGIRNLDEEINGINRTLHIDAATDQSMTLEWRLPNEDGYKFAVIGDTGGNTELDWCLQRSKALDARFVIHLGDFNYGNGDYQRAIALFHNAPLPCYITIGNHDFNDNGLVYQHFRSQLGMFNHAFEVAGTRFVNFDTAADFLPSDGGMRGTFFEQLASQTKPDQIFFTHRPLRDPRPNDDHIVSGWNENEWLQKMIKKSGRGTLLTGHVHHSAELDINGIHQYTVGEGLGFEDILLQRPVAQLLMGVVETGEAPKFQWADLEMPWTYHQSHTHLKKLKKRDDQRLIKWYKNQISV